MFDCVGEIFCKLGYPSSDRSTYWASVWGGIVLEGTLSWGLGVKA